MKPILKIRNIGLTAASGAILVGGAMMVLSTPRTAWAQESAVAAPPDVSIDHRDTPIREALEQLFRSAKVDYSIDPTVQGYVNLKVTDIPFENALKLILRSSTTPLTYTKEGDVYMVKPRTVSRNTSEAPTPGFALAADVPPARKFESIELTYADPADLAQLLNITMIPIGTRHGLKVPGAAGIITPGSGRGNGGAPTGGVNTGAGNPGGTIINSDGAANGAGNGLGLRF